MDDIAKDLWKPSSLTPSSKQVIQDYVHFGFEYLQVLSLHNLSGQPVAVFDSHYKKFCFF